MLPPSFDPPPYILAILQSKKRGVNTNPHTHNIENFHCGPTNLNDPLLNHQYKERVRYPY